VDKYTGLFLVVYLATVLKHDNARALFDNLSQETGFFKWVIALGLVYLVASRLDKAGDQLITLVFVSMTMDALIKNPNLFNDISGFLTNSTAGEPQTTTA
jgi:hypothetical protein